ncbi:MAG: bifunctional DNA-binding transcriptional regulator/O6-methylguanine-DNA methyltransferase Ada [Granulosicoccus sp.]
MNSYQSDTQRLQAVQSRDAQADGQFVYAVLSTGIVCYPSCPSRTALPENMRYYRDVAEALAAGYRVCKRCRTDLPPLATRNRQLVVQACQRMNDSHDAVRIDSIADSLGISRFHLVKLFKQHIGLSPKVYAQAIRAQKLRDNLSVDQSITQSLLDAGYDSIGSFYADVQKRLGMKATSLRNGSFKLSIRYGFADSRFGLIVVAQTDKGVCAVLFGDTRKELEQELSTRFPKAMLQHDEHDVQARLAAVVDKIRMPASSLQIPLDIQGTVFQEKVWQALGNIVPGQTASYAEVAQSIGQPKAARAVAKACAANPVAVLVPCHRVVRGDGSLSGYRWSIERKRALLDAETQSTALDHSRD